MAHVTYSFRGEVITETIVDVFVTKCGDLLGRYPGSNQFVWILAEDLIELQEVV